MAPRLVMYKSPSSPLWRYAASYAACSGSSMFPAFREYVLLKEGTPDREVAEKR